MRWDSQGRDAIVIGSGPNGLAAAITLARVGLSVLLVESGQTLGGGARTDELTLPGFRHDVCSSVYPLAVGSPFFRSLPLVEHGLKWVHPIAPLAHPWREDSAVLLERSTDLTTRGLGVDAGAYRRLLGSWVEKWPLLEGEILSPPHLVRNPFLLARFGLQAGQSALSQARRRFQTEPARALFAGLAAHSIMPLESLGTAAFGLLLGILGHATGWPFVQGGSQNLIHSLRRELDRFGVEVQTEITVTRLEELPPSRALLFDTDPRQMGRIAASRLPSSYVRRLNRFQHGPGAFKLDWALSAPIPWRDPQCARAGTVHVGGSADEIAQSERLVWEGGLSERPFLLVTQPSLFDGDRAPTGRHTAWAYCHVPSGSTIDATDRIEAQMERFAPGFRDCILARHAHGPASLERYNANYVGGDIACGANVLSQLLVRPVVRWDPYRTPVRGLYLCSAATPPGAGVHGLCGYYAAQTALRHEFKINIPRHPGQW